MKYTEEDREVKRSIKTDKRKWMENIASKAEDERPRQSRETNNSEVYRGGQGGEEEYKDR